MTRSELILKIASECDSLPARDVQLAVKTMLDQMSGTLAEGGRIEIRGFGSFALRYRPPRIGRNPRTGEQVQLGGRHVPHFKPGKEMRERVDQAATAERGD